MPPFVKKPTLPLLACVKTVSARDARVQFSNIVGAVRYQGKTVVVMKHNRPAAAFISIDALKRLDQFEAKYPGIYETFVAHLRKTYDL